FAEKRRALISEIEQAESGRRFAADALAAAETAMAETDRAAKASLEALSSARETCARAEERMDGTRRRLGDVEREIHDMLEVEPQAVAGLAEIEPGVELPPLAEIEENLEKMRRDRERLGAVNLRAEEELREVEAQHTALTTERDDLVEAIKRLRQGIQSLNREARDDHNVERFCTLLHEMTASTETRFIIITHNPITMARMNRLFGVTMAERGVSQLVSVDLEDAVKILDVA